MNGSVALLASVGFFGKLPCRGDFVQRRLSAEFVAAWDEWMQQCLHASRQALGDGWLDVYLTSPIWRFAFSHGVCGPGAQVGVVMPSVDKVGRYFPISVVAELPDGVAPLSVLANCGDWFAATEALLLRELEQEEGDFEFFDAETLGLAGLLESRLTEALPAVSSLQVDTTQGLDGVLVPIASIESAGQRGMSLLQYALDCHEAAAAVWTTNGSERVTPSWMMTRGLPDPQKFVAMLDGNWTQGGWRLADAWRPLPASDGPDLPEVGSDISVDSSGVTDAGAVRTENQDAFLSRPDLGLWMVADGMGGHSGGAHASQMIKDALAGLEPRVDLDAMFESVMDELRQVNSYLFGASQRPVNPVRSGSTVVILLIRGTRAACIWSGDSRAYLVRNGRMSPITRDHSEQQAWRDMGDADAAESAQPNVITRAIGGTDELETDVNFIDVNPGDQFLLCSDGLYRALAEKEIVERLEPADPWAVVSDLLQRALQAGAEDNVTAILVNIAAQTDSDLT